ncbi:Cytochrome C oxidase, cbb3-type, subunit III [Bryocella elongata]|uniref:Cytochrome C oxidase, cbb3-type, subunit III n=1 Tax=Bryocella elongata TaxID=863522 RepID=A0A1H5YJ18_9BACT|nr:cytochrome c [Bryocella elongata]SEG23700.1 Cytochrome C oxidase, cbb3-type, subunit III [Bryocella elongata]
MMRAKYIPAAGAAVAMLLLAGCRQDMHDQPKFFPQRGTTFYADGRSVRPQVADTVAREQLHEDSYFYTGMIAGKEGDGLPLALTPELMARGQERYNVYCTACHSRVGNGDGMIVQRGYKPAGNFHTDRLRNAPLGHFFAVMTNGYGAMPDYSAQLTPADRWAVAAYVRALQLSQDAKPSDAGSATAQNLETIATKQGLPASYADPMKFPGTAVWANPKTQEDMTTPVSPMGKPAAAPATEKQPEAPAAGPKAASTNP